MTELATPQFDMQEVMSNGFAMAKPMAGDDQLWVQFFYKSVINRARSRQEGRPIEDNEIWVKIVAPGEAQIQAPEFKANDLHKRRFPRQWMQFQQGRQQVTEGTTLQHLFPDQPNKVKMLNSYNIHTVEQLANLNDTGLQRIGMGALADQQKAQKYIAQAEKGVNYHKFNTEMEAKDVKISTLEQQIQNLSAQMQAMVNAQQQPVYQPQMPQMPNPTQLPTPPNIETANALLGNQEFMSAPDLSTEVAALAPRRGGRPKGSKNKPKEN